MRQLRSTRMLCPMHELCFKQSRGTRRPTLSNIGLARPFESWASLILLSVQQHQRPLAATAAATAATIGRRSKSNRPTKGPYLRKSLQGQS
jgi:hypothetical protein